MNDWLRNTWKNASDEIGYLVCNGNDFQHQNEVAILSEKGNATSTFFKPITVDNILKSCIYFSVRHAIEADWLNDRDQFLRPDDSWVQDLEFQSDCVVFALFHGQNRISSAVGANHWIPFPEKEVDAKGLYKSHFMIEWMTGKTMQMVAPRQREFGFEGVGSESAAGCNRVNVLDHLSSAARNVMDAGRELWRYYHSQMDANPNASYYDIRLHFQGVVTGAKGKPRMRNDSSDVTYSALVANLRSAMKVLSCQVAPKVYEHGFLRK